MIENSTKKKADRSELTHLIAENALIAALYFVLTIAIQPLSYGAIQFRFSEILVLLAFFKPSYCLGLTIGCIFANAASLSPWDMLFGSMATLVSCLLMSYFSRHLLISLIWPTLINGVVVGLEVSYIFFDDTYPVYLNMLFVALGELGVMIVGYVIFMVLKKNRLFWDKVVKPTRHANWVW